MWGGLGAATTFASLDHVDCNQDEKKARDDAAYYHSYEVFLGNMFWKEDINLANFKPLLQ